MTAKKNKKQTLDAELEDFLSSALVARLSAGISPGAVVEMRVSKQVYQVTRERKKCVFHKLKFQEPDVVLTLSESTLRHLLDVAALPETGVAELGICVFEHIFTADADKKISLHLRVGLFTIFRKGYFSILQAGGPEVMAYLAKYGFSSLAKIKEAIAKMRSSED